MGRRAQQAPPSGWLVAQTAQGWIALHFDAMLRAWVEAAGPFQRRGYAIGRAHMLEERRRQWLWGEIDRRVTSFGTHS